MLAEKFFLVLETLLSRAEPDGSPRIVSCVYRKPHPSVMPRWNHLSWRDDRAVLLRSGRPGLAIQVEVTA
jgi:hypothetical protein